MTDQQEAKQATPPETLLAELLDSRVPKSEREHAAKREIECLRADLETERMRLVACGVAALANTADSAARARDILPEYRSASLDDVERAVDREIQLRDERNDLRDVLLRNGFVPCDSPACNCGSWHARFGLPERMQEINHALSDAGHPLSNGNGNLAINALRQLVAERDELAKAFLALHATVVGECPSLLDEDSGGSSSLIELVADALAQAEKTKEG